MEETILNTLELNDPNGIIQVDLEIMGGTPWFTGTRVPIKNIFDFIEAVDSLNEFLDAFPTVSREDTIFVLQLAEQSILGKAA